MKTADAPQDNYPAHWPAARSWTRLAVRTRNPLLRPPTRRERLVTRLAFAGLVTLAVTLVLVCLGVFQRGTTAERVEGAQRHRITALVTNATDPRVVGNRYVVAGRAHVSYTFEGESRTGVAAMPQGAHTGASVRIWIDRRGELTSPPQTRARTVRDVVLVALFSLTAWVVLVAGGRVAYDAWSLREHADAWDEEWLRFDREH